MLKNAIVTGGVRRLGRYISYFLADEGYNLALIYNSSSKAELAQTSKVLSSKGIKFRFYECDITDSVRLKKVIGSIGKEFKKIDLLINNAGMITKIDFEKITTELFDKTIALNLKAPLFVSQYSLQYLRRAKAPLIINIASLGGLQNWSGFMPYSVSKTGLIKLTFLLARKLAPKIRVNAIAPGTIIIEGEEKGTLKKIDMDKIPLKKYGNPNDVIAAVKFIIECQYLTGHVIPVDGGSHLNN
ncbi:MAG: SDR family oxidoreductase [Ignavibacteria bacterium]|nr:SDR family oxidoreductase [Ignavibacteria bacterium]